MKKRFLIVFLTTLLLTFVLAMQASAATVISGNCGDNVSYVLDSNGTLTLTGTGPTRNYSLSPDVPWYSYSSSIKEIIISDGVTTLGDRIFNSCSAITAVSIPNSVTSIGDYSFSGCSGLTELDLSEQLEVIGSYSFYSCSKLVDITLPDAVKEIGNSAFSNCSALHTLNIPASVQSIGLAAFYDCTALTAVHVNQNNPHYLDVGGVVFSKDKTELVLYPAGRTASTYHIPAGITRVGAYSFFHCEALTQISIPDSVTEIAGYAFRQCTNLTSITIPSNVKTIGEYAFYGCINLAELNLPHGLTSIGDFAFYYGLALPEVILPDTVTYIGRNAFRYCIKMHTFVVLGDDIYIDEEAFTGCKALTNFRFTGDAPTELSYNAFYGSVATIHFPVDGEGWAEFIPLRRAGNLTWTAYNNYEMVDSGTYGAEETLFWSLKQDGTLFLDGTGDMPDFEEGSAPWSVYCTDIKYVVLSAKITYIGSYAFFGCSQLEELWFLGSAPTFHDNAFSNIVARARFSLERSYWTSTRRLDYGGTITWVPIGRSDTLLAFGTYGENGSWTIDCNGYMCIDGTEDIPDYELYKTPWHRYREYVTTLVVKNEISRIGTFAFYAFNKLEAAYLVTDCDELTINERAFYACRVMTEISLPSATTLGPEVFRACSKLKTIYINDASGTDALTRFVPSDTSFYSLYTTIYYPTGLSAPETTDTYGAKRLTWTEVSRGTCGAQVYWKFDAATGTLTLSGDGFLRNYASAQDVPWNHLNWDITCVVVEEGIRDLPAHIFENLTNVVSVSLPHSLQTMSCSTWSNCTQLNNLILPGSLSALTDTQFPSCDALTDLYFLGTEEEWDQVEHASDLSGLTVHFLTYHETTATCTQPGIATYYTFEGSTVYTGLYDTNREEVAELPVSPALGHSYTDNASDLLAQEATCTVPAQYYARCDRCSAISDTETVAVGECALHQFTDYTSDNNATCRTDGTETAFCDAGCGVSKERVIAGTMVTHQFTFYNSNSDATCLEDGTETAFCEFGCGTIKTQAEENSQRSHDFYDYTSNNDATCMENGTETAHCYFECGTTDTRVAENSTVDHKYSNYASNGDSTCQHDGTETASCDFGCGATDTRTVENSTVEHKYSNYVSNGDSTCQQNGTETASCDFDCGTTDTRTAASVGTHRFTTYNPNGDASCQTDGTETAFCDFGCGTTDTRTDAGSKLAHIFSFYYSNNDATCQADGTESASCSFGCGAVDTRTVANSKREHLYSDATDTTCDQCGAERNAMSMPEPPVAGNTTYLAGLKLSDVALSNGTVLDAYGNPVSGTWSWSEPNTVMYAGATTHLAVFTPNDSTISAISTQVEIIVPTADQVLTSQHASPEAICIAYAGPGLEMKDMVTSNLDVQPVFVVTEDEGEAYVEGTVLYSPDAGFVTVQARYPAVDLNGDGINEYNEGCIEIHTKFTTVSMFRMYDPNSGEHFYTGSIEEVNILIAEGWQEEGVGFNYPALGAPVYRLYNPVSGDHLYTMNLDEIARLESEGWNVEGVAFNSAADTEVAQYRLWNPNAVRGAWHFTSDAGERDYLISLGWQDQGIGWYSTQK